MTYAKRKHIPLATALGSAALAAALAHAGMAAADVLVAEEADDTAAEYSVEADGTLDESAFQEEQASPAQATAPRVHVRGFGDISGATLLAICADGTLVELPCLPDPDEDGDYLVVQGLDELPAGTYTLSAPEGWTLAGALADPDTQSPRELELLEGTFTLVLPAEDLAALDLAVEAAYPEQAADAPESGPADAPADQPAPAQDETPVGPDMSGAQASGMPMAGGVSADPLSFLLQVVENGRNSGSNISVTWYDAQSGAVGYTRG